MDFLTREFLMVVMIVASGLETGFCVLTKSSGPKQLWNATSTDSLKRDLLLNYDKFTRPSRFQNTTEVSLDLQVRHIDVDELKSVLSVYGWLTMLWKDEKLQWNSTDYGGVTSLHLADHEIWQPDIVLYNSASGSNIDHYGNTHAILKEDGSVVWVPPTMYLVFCELDLRLWPYDTQVCTLTLGSWTYDGNQISLEVYDDQGQVQTELLIENNEWQIESMTKRKNVKKYSCCEEPYHDLEYTITLRRRSPTYSALVITPASAVILMTLINFWLPPQSGDKIILNGVNSIIICIFLLYFSQKLPAMAMHTPLVVQFYSSSLYLVSFSMIISVIVINLSCTKHVQPLPWVLKNFLSGCPGKLLGLGHLMVQATPSVRAEELREHNVTPFDEHSSSDDNQMLPQAPRVAAQQDWVLLAVAVDRIAFLVYCFVFAILAAAYSV